MESPRALDAAAAYFSLVINACSQQQHQQVEQQPAASLDTLYCTPLPTLIAQAARAESPLVAHAQTVDNCRSSRR